MKGQVGEWSKGASIGAASLGSWDGQGRWEQEVAGGGKIENNKRGQGVG